MNILPVVTRQHAKEHGLKRFNTGRPCIHGHDSERFTASGVCVRCIREKHKVRRLSAVKVPKVRKIRNPANATDRHRQYRERHPDRVKATQKAYRDKPESKARNKARCAQWEIDNREKRRAISQRTAERIGEQIRARRRIWEKENYERRKWIKAHRRAMKKNAAPPWVDKTALREIYESAPAGYHVDHIVPLVHPTVCGLHVPWNLQYLPALENLRKGNRL